MKVMDKIVLLHLKYFLFIQLTNYLIVIISKSIEKYDNDDIMKQIINSLENILHNVGCIKDKVITVFYLLCSYNLFKY